MSYTSHDNLPVIASQAIEQQLTLRRQEIDRDREQWQIQRWNEQQKIDAAKAKLVEEAMKLKAMQVEQLMELSRLDAARSDVEHEKSVVVSQRNAVATREVALQALENRILRNRKPSEVYIDDVYPNIGAHEAVKNLTHSSLRVREHCRNNVSFCISGSSNPGPKFLSLRPQNIAPFILPQIHIIASSPNVTALELAFCFSVVANSLLVAALVQCGEHRRLGQWLLEVDNNINGLAIRALRLMISLDASTAKAAYTTLSTAVPLVPDRDSPESGYHPSVDFLVETAARLIKDCFANNMHAAISPLVLHRVDRIRVAVLPVIVAEAETSEATQMALVQAGIHKLLNHIYVSVSPPQDVSMFFVTLVPIIAKHLCVDETNTSWLIKRIADPNALISDGAVQALRDGATSNDARVYNAFVEVDVLHRLSQPPTPQTLAVTQLLLDIIPKLAPFYARKNALPSVLAFINHPNSRLSSVCVAACIEIAKSTAENRARLYEATKQLDHSNESVLALLDHALPLFCKDWATSNNLTRISEYLFHPQRRLRSAAGGVWLDIISTSPPIRKQLVSQKLLGVIFQLCESPDVESSTLGAKLLPHVALNIFEAGSSSMGRLLALLEDYNGQSRQSALQSVQLIAESGSKGRQALHEAGIFSLLLSGLESHPFSDLDAVRKTVVALARLEASSPKSCTGLLLLLESSDDKTVHLAQRALSTIEMQSVSSRQILLKCIMERLIGASQALLDYAAKAIREWIGSDLTQLGNLKDLYTLVFNPSPCIEEAALAHLKRMILDPPSIRILMDSDFIEFLVGLTSSGSQNCMEFLAACLTDMAETLVLHDSLDLLTRCITHTAEKIRASSAQALLKVSKAGDSVRLPLTHHELLEALVENDADVELEIVKTNLAAEIFPNIALDYLRAGKLDFFLNAIDHHNEAVQKAAVTSLSFILQSSAEQRPAIHKAVLQRLDFASPVFCEVAAKWISDSIAISLLVGFRYPDIFKLMEHRHSTIRTSTLDQLRLHLQTGDEGLRRKILDAGLIPLVSQSAENGVHECLIFLLNVLPVLGPAILWHDGGALLVSFLHHQDVRLRSASITSIRNGVGSRHGNLQRSAKGALISALYPMIREDSDIRDLWCYILPALVPYLCHQRDIEILFSGLSHPHPDVITASENAIMALWKVSEETNLLLFPVLLHHLDQDVVPSPNCLARVIRYSGAIFVNQGKATELLQLIQETDENRRAIVLAAADTIIDLLRASDGQKLVNANIFSIVLYMRRSAVRLQKEIGGKLTVAVIHHLSYLLMMEKQSAETLIDLLDEENEEISREILSALSNDSSVNDSPYLVDIIESLAHPRRQKLDTVCKLLCNFAPKTASPMLNNGRANVVVSLLRSPKVEIAQSYLQETFRWVSRSSPDQLNYLIDEPEFVPTIGSFLNSNDGTLRRLASEVVGLLCNDSPLRSRKMVNAGIASFLAWVSEHGTRNAQPASILSLLTLFKASPDDSEQLVADSLPALRAILEDDQRDEAVYTNALTLLWTISQKYSHSAIIQCGILPFIVVRLSPQHATAQQSFAQLVYDIAQSLAAKSDQGRKALMEHPEFLTILFQLVTHSSATEVINGCRILDAVARSGTYYQDLHGLEDEMKRIVSPIKRSRLVGATPDQKLEVQRQAKSVLESLKSNRSVAKNPIRTKTLLKASSGGVEGGPQAKLTAVPPYTSDQPRSGGVDFAMNQHRRSVSDQVHDREQLEPSWRSYGAATTSNNIGDSTEEETVIPRSHSLHRRYQSTGHSRRDGPSNLSIVQENDSSEHIQPIPMMASSLGSSSPPVAGPSGGNAISGVRRAYSLGAKGLSVPNARQRDDGTSLAEDGTRSEAPSYHTTW